ncbi:50S ribosomal protein L11 methyltransferase [Oligoflexus tunisiensis]|uniref:50S ribosomal protein L11 methyltransferase n=1 Tax=Oligoflexus tunisiensis TaxID=708132 RepID=UPI00114CDB25|nr:50S ribosomal protein L11 methyltransferase [Oligoflexus tunisiensis]
MESHSSRPLSPLVFLFPVGQTSPLPATPRLGLAQIPSSAFGDGSHPTTRLCAGAVDFLCRTQAISNFLDVGTGTGVLARIARARGAKFVAGTDIDPLALEAAQRNADLDGASLPIAFENAPPDHWGTHFDLITANILEEPLRELAPALVRALVPGGQLLLSGFTRLQAPGLRLWYQSFGMQLLSESELDGWILMHLAKAQH